MKLFWMGKKKQLLVAAALCVSFIGAPLAQAPAEAASFSQEDLNDELMMAVGWMQNSAEYRELWNHATAIVSSALRSFCV